MPNFVSHLYGFSYRGWLALTALILLVWFSAVLFKRVTGGYEKPGEKMFRLQLAWTAERFKETLTDWSTVNRRAPEIYKWDNLVKLDSFFPLIYAIYFAFAYAWATGNPRPVNRWDLFFFLLPFCAALFDYFENAFHLYLLRGIDTREQVASALFPEAVVRMSTICSYLKFSLSLVAAVAYLVPLAKRLLGLLALLSIARL
jgi:hypothetical protein